MLTLGIFTLLISAIAAWLVTPAVIFLAGRIGAVDLPDPRKVHRSPMPRIGGVAILIGFLSGVLFAGQATGYLFALPETAKYWTVVGIAALCMFALGLVDDIRGLSFKTKLSCQVLAALAVWIGGFRVEMLSVPFGSGPMDLGWLSLPITILWIVGITNAINLIDGLDGLAAGTALIVTVAVAVIAMFRGFSSVVGMSAALVGSLLGFLVFNFNPAKIFLGDSGSMFLGFMLAVMSIRSNQKGTTVVAVMAPLLVLGLPILDTSLAVVRRLLRVGFGSGSPGVRIQHMVRNAHVVFLPDRGHLHHRLMDTGLSHRSTVLVLYSAVIVLALAALVDVIWDSPMFALYLVGVLVVLLALFLLAMPYLRRRNDNGRNKRKEDAVPGRNGPVLSKLAGQRKSAHR